MKNPGQMTGVFLFPGRHAVSVITEVFAPTPLIFTYRFLYGTRRGDLYENKTHHLRSSPRN